MEWTPEIAVTVGGVFVGLIMVFSSLVAAFVLIVKKLGERADSALLGLMADQNEAQAKRDEAQTRQDEIQAKNSSLQAEALTSLAASQESQAKSLEYLGQLHQGASAALTVMMDQLRPLPTMLASINNIEEQSKTMVDDMDKLDIMLQRLDEIHAMLADEIKPRLASTEVQLGNAEAQLAETRTEVMALKRAATQEQEIVAVNPKPIEQGAKPDERTIEQLDDLAGSSSSAGDDKRDGDGSGSEASASASAS